MRKAEVILALLNQRTTDCAEYVFHRLYRNFYNPEFYLLAYRFIAQRNSITRRNQHIHLEQVRRLIEKMKRESFYPIAIRNSNTSQNKSTSFDVLPIEDQLVQEVLRFMLEAIFAPLFLESSHGFRPNRNIHTGLLSFKQGAVGSTWLIKGTIQSFFSGIDHSLLINRLGKKMNDGRILELVKRFLHAGYLEWPNNQLCPILSNIYYHELDVFVDELMENKKGAFAQHEPILLSSRNIHYVRYNDHFLIGIRGTKGLAKQVYQKIATFLDQELNIRPSQGLLQFCHLADQSIQFLGYELTRAKSNQELQPIQLLVSNQVLRSYLKPYSKHNKPAPHPARVHLDLFELISLYRREMSRLYDYYCLASDVSSKLGTFRYFHYYSLAKTIALKEKISVKQVFQKYGVDVKRRQGTGTKRLIGIGYKAESGLHKVLTYFDQPLKRQGKAKLHVNDDSCRMIKKHIIS
ncbi:Retron-type reverse transcriptase [Seinonella peptonophila]|uniref:Retron-type reverse transcriptase n=1 Tax=Seinonella peptonophila TaxID=112248 RepID=A0A1M4WYM5_9BACL|nr:reverse transcriptase/maturase family protein [Seinonella peptonophila]SHE86295.1 Retron-type reverse transcriptase [Seinonella peptonophila]